MCGWPVSSLYLTVNSLSLSFSIRLLFSGPEAFEDAHGELDRVDVVVDPDVLVGGMDAAVRAAGARRPHDRDAEALGDRVHGPGSRREGPDGRSLAEELLLRLQHGAPEPGLDRGAGRFLQLGPLDLDLPEAV